MVCMHGNKNRRRGDRIFAKYVFTFSVGKYLLHFRHWEELIFVQPDFLTGSILDTLDATYG